MLRLPFGADVDPKEKENAAGAAAVLFWSLLLVGGCNGIVKPVGADACSNVKPAGAATCGALPPKRLDPPFCVRVGLPKRLDPKPPEVSGVLLTPNENAMVDEFCRRRCDFCVVVVATS